MKKCNMCKVLKTLSEFSKNSRNKTDGRQPKCKQCNKNYFEKNKRRIKKRIGEHYKENNKEILERRAELRKRPEAKKIKAATDASHYRKNKKKILDYYKGWAKENRDIVNKNQKDWYWSNLEHARMMSRVNTRKRSLWALKNGNNTLTVTECENLMKMHPYCDYCKIKSVRFAIEHIIPLCRGGQNCLSNVTIACYPCNLSKGSKLLSEWKGSHHRE